MRWLSDETIAHLRKLAEWPDLGETKYVLRAELGRGGMGTVYLAEDTVLGRMVALKVVGAAEQDPETARRMLLEARIVARLEHPGIVPVHDVGTLPDGRVYYAMKRVDGRRLDELTSEMTLPERLRLLQRICDAVAFAHAHGVIHRDLKPENVMVGTFGEVLVMDWGVAKVTADDATRVPPESDAPSPEVRALGVAVGEIAATAEGAVVGTLAYMAPEQAEGRRELVGPSSDIYALGALLYFLLVGRPPFEGDAAARRAKGEARAAPPSPRSVKNDVPRPLEAIAVKAMAVDAEDRYASAAEMGREVARFFDGERVHAHRENPFERGVRFFARHRAPIFLILAYLFMRTLLIFWRRH